MSTAVGIMGNTIKNVYYQHVDRPSGKGLRVVFVTEEGYTDAFDIEGGEHAQRIFQLMSFNPAPEHLMAEIRQAIGLTVH